MLKRAGHAPPPEAGPTLPEVADAFDRIEAASGPGAQVGGAPASLLERSDPLTAKYIVKVLGGDLRIGLREGLVEAAIAKAFDRPLDDVKWAGMLVGDVGRLAELARDDALDSASLALFHPLKFMLASPAEDAAEIVGRLGPEVWVEDKYDGIRAQLHKPGTDVRLYSRDLHDVSGGFPEIVAAAAALAVGRHPRRRDPRLARRHGAAVHRAPGPARPQVTVRGDPGGGAGHLRRLRRARAGARRRAPRSSRCSACRCASGGPRLDALDLPLATDGGRFARSHLVAAGRRRRARGRLPRRPGRRNEGLMVKDPTASTPRAGAASAG